jgi:hypothetical protein
MVFPVVWSAERADHEVAGDGAAPSGEAPFHGGRDRQEPLSPTGSGAWDKTPCKSLLHLRAHLPSRWHSIRREVDLFGVVGGLCGIGIIRSGENALVSSTGALCPGRRGRVSAARAQAGLTCRKLMRRRAPVPGWAGTREILNTDRAVVPHGRQDRNPVTPFQ